MNDDYDNNDYQDTTPLPKWSAHGGHSRRPKRAKKSLPGPYDSPESSENDEDVAAATNQRDNWSGRHRRHYNQSYAAHGSPPVGGGDDENNEEDDEVEDFGQPPQLQRSVCCITNYIF